MERTVYADVHPVVWQDINFVSWSLALTGIKHIEAVLAEKFLLTCDLMARKTNG